MSGEVEHPSQEDTTSSKPIYDDTHRPKKPADSGIPDSSVSAPSPVTSTFLNSASSTAQASPTLGPSFNSNSEHFSSDTALEQPAATQAAGSGSDAVGQQIPQTDSKVGQAGALDSVSQEKSAKRRSRGSIEAPSRKGSAASSRLSKRGRTLVSDPLRQEKPVEHEPSSDPERPRKKGISRLFSVLNCCSPSKDDHISESQQALPPKKTKTLQANRGRQPTPLTKPDASAGESSKTESKEAIEDNIAGPPYSELTPAAKPKIIEPPKKEVPMTEKPPTAIDGPPSADSKMVPPEPTVSDQPLPPLPSDHKDAAGNTNGSFDEKSAALGADGLAEPTVPATIPVVDEGVSKEEMAINDRTPQQEARDIEMPDAPPVPPIPEQPVAHQENTVPVASQPNLPPPPPTSPPNRPTSAGRQGSNGATTNEQPKWLLPPMADRFRGKKCLVLDLDETLVHSSFKILHQADFTIPVEIEGQYHNVYVIKRPGVDQFMKRVGELYEVVVFTASVSKDLSQVGRDLRETIIIDNSPTSYIFHPQHAVPISSWFSDAHDNELLDLIPVLEDLAGPQVRDVSLVLDVGL
ncbi:MAG: hypothetical protein Q9219_005847 [cf. Caloplaca sp. 3 TL-2023]